MYNPGNDYYELYLPKSGKGAREPMKPRVQPYGTKNISGANIEALRKARGMRQFELVQQMQLRGVDINPSSLSKLEGQVRVATDRELYAIAQIFGVTMESLVQPNE